MLLHHIKLAFRNIFRNKLFSSINIIGLAIGISASFMMFLIVSHEMSYDKHITNIERKGRIVLDENINNYKSAKISPLVSNQLKEYAPFIDNVGRVSRIRCKINNENNSDIKLQSFFIDESIIDLLSIKFLSGIAAEDMSTVIISNKLAARLFTEKNPIGEIINVKFRNQEYSLKVSGIFSDFPETSTFRANMLFPMSLAEQVMPNFSLDKNRDVFNDRKAFQFITYFELNDKTTFSELNEVLIKLSKKEFSSDINGILISQKLSDVYFSTEEYGREGFPRGDKQKIFILMGISILILIIATINFILLNVSKLLKRIEEIGIRKVVGATSGSLILYTIVEACVSGILATPIILLIVQYSFSSLLDLINIKMATNQLEYWNIYLMILIFITTIGVISGLLIALPTSRAKAIIAIRGSNFHINNNLLMRRFYITTQIAIAVFLLMTIIVVKNQIASFYNSDVGFDGNNLLVITNSNWDPRFNNKIDVLKNELKKISTVEEITAAMELPPQDFHIISDISKNDSDDEKVSVWMTGVDINFINTMKMELIEGRAFNKDFPTDKNEACILNETAMKELGIGSDRELKAQNKKIIGVVKDYNIGSFREEIMPVIISLADNMMMNDIILRVSDKNIAQTIKDVDKVLNNVIPDIKYNYQFYDEKLNVVYKDELKFSRLIDIATALALILTSLGILGITLFIVQEKTKEIGIRKVLGASISNLVTMLSKEFILLVGIGVLVASPFAYYIMSKWLDNFAYKIEIGFSTVLITATLALFITLFTVGIQAVRAAIANPVESLRDE